MLWVHARRDIASMKHELRIGDSSIVDLPRESMSLDVATALVVTVPMESAVAERRFSPSPQPAAGFILSHLGPEALNEGASFHFMATISESRFVQ
jgi:hypothetical protein